MSDSLASGKDKRTTFMIRNIPNKYTQQMLIEFLNETHAVGSILLDHVDCLGSFQLFVSSHGFQEQMQCRVCFYQLSATRIGDFFGRSYSRKEMVRSLRCTIKYQGHASIVTK